MKLHKLLILKIFGFLFRCLENDRLKLFCVMLITFILTFIIILCCCYNIAEMMLKGVKAITCLLLTFSIVRREYLKEKVTDLEHQLKALNKLQDLDSEDNNKRNRRKSFFEISEKEGAVDRINRDIDGFTLLQVTVSAFAFTQFLEFILYLIDLYIIQK